MKLTWIATFPVAAALLILPSVTRAQSGQTVSEAPAVVELTKKIDSQKLTSGATVETKLVHSVKLADGTVLPTGTKLIATVADDDMQLTGKSKLVLRFTTAELKGGKSFPIKATILAVSTLPVPVEGNPDASEPAMAIPDNFTGVPETVDQPEVTSGVDLHSKADSHNSGVFVAVSKADVRLPDGTKMELAIAPAGSASSM